MTRHIASAVVLALFVSFATGHTDQANATTVGVAKTYQGLHEGKHSGSLSRLLKVNPRKTPWCAAFANAVLKKSGKKGSGSLAAKSFFSWGTRVTSPRQGDVVIIKTKRGYHVGFYVGRKGNQVLVIGGNQSNSVKVTAYSARSVAQYRRG
jgi:uncharacterized protein (TIGR02594 family)